MKVAKLQLFSFAPCFRIYRAFEEAIVADKMVWLNRFLILINTFAALEGSQFCFYLLSMHKYGRLGRHVNCYLLKLFAKCNLKNVKWLLQILTWWINDIKNMYDLSRYCIYTSIIDKIFY